MTMVFNMNYGPWMRGATMLKKQELLKEHNSLCSEADADYAGLVGEVARDMGCVMSSNSADHGEWYKDLIWCNQNFTTKGVFVKQSAWYSIMPAIEKYEKHFKVWRLLMRWVTKVTMSPSKKALDAREKS